MRLDELTQPGWGDAADYFCQRDMKNSTTELKVVEVVEPQTEMTAATPSPTTSGELMQVLELIPGKSQMAQVTSRQGSSNMRLVLEKPQADNQIESLPPDRVTD